MRHATIVFLHAHPDDEAIFTGGTIRLLADAGHRVVVVMATGGELGVAGDSGLAADLGAHRRAETHRSAALLGVSDVLFLGYADSGLDGAGPRGLATTAPSEAADRLVELLARHRLAPDALVIYDETGIYGHPDHVAVHRMGHLAADLAGVATVYESTVDREYLHFVETHLVVEAGLPDRPPGLALSATSLGSATVEIDLGVDVLSALGAKRAAMAAHGSQIPADAPALALDDDAFAAVYGLEWYRRRGPAGALDVLPAI